MGRTYKYRVLLLHAYAGYNIHYAQLVYSRKHSLNIQKSIPVFLGVAITKNKIKNSIKIQKLSLI